MSVLNKDVKELKGIGEYYASILNKHDIKNYFDLIWLFPNSNMNLCPIDDLLKHVNHPNPNPDPDPRDVSQHVSHPKNTSYPQDAGYPSQNKEAATRPGRVPQLICANLTVTSSISKVKQKAFTTIRCVNANNQEVTITFFTRSKLFFYKGAKICVFGELKQENGGLVMTHPKYVPGHKTHFTNVEYSIPKIPPSIINRSILSILDMMQVEMVEKSSDWSSNCRLDWLPDDILHEKGWSGFIESMKTIQTSDDSIKLQKAKERIIFDEALAYQYGIYQAGIKLAKSDQRYSFIDLDVNDLIVNFGKELTECQKRAWHEIKEDLLSEKQMLRILYGDVGSGKTLVAFLAMALCYRNGKQSALLVPTEILAKQHFNLLTQLMPDANIVLLTSSTKSKYIYDKIKNENCIVIGTHAIFQEKVSYNELGLLIIDEQHRFGVLQRMAIKSLHNILFMTATPIPRTLKLSLIGSIPITKILSRPQLHRSIDVRILSSNTIDKVLEKMKSLLNEDDNIFWVCPFVEQSEKKDGMDVVSRHRFLSEKLNYGVGFLHGQMPYEQKEIELEKFYNKENRVLVSTTVIEVGINIPHANTIIIENAELFGMAQLYQLMGRVGRGHLSGRCYFIYNRLSHEARLRLEALKTCKSGLELAEQDMYIRGFGNILGTEQSGRSYFHCLDIARDQKIFEEAGNFLHNNINSSSFIESMSNLANIFSYLYSPWSSG